MTERQKFLINQPVVVGNEIGKIVHRTEQGPFDHWVYLPSKGYASSFADENVRPYSGCCCA